jgi:hypothetical protein
MLLSKTFRKDPDPPPIPQSVGEVDLPQLVIQEVHRQEHPDPKHRSGRKHPDDAPPE